MRIISIVWFCLFIFKPTFSQTSEVKTFYKSGNLKEVYQIGTDSIKDGKYSIFYENGNLWQNGSFIEGSLEGDWQMNYPEGNLEQVCSFKNGKLEGKLIAYYPNGDLYQKINYKK